MGRNDTDHYIYPLTGERLTRVSTVLDRTDGKQRFLVPWSSRITAECAVDHLRVLEAVLARQATCVRTKETGRQGAVDLTKGRAADERDLKAEVGTWVHDMVEALVLWQASPEGRGADVALPALPDHLKGQDYDDEPVENVAAWMVNGFLNWVTAWQPQFRAAEMTVYNYGLGVAGTLDLIVFIPGVAVSPSGRFIPGPGLLVCVDVKTGRNSGPTWRDQIAAYRQMTECQPDRLSTDLYPMPRTDCGAVLHLRPEHLDGYRFMPISGKKHAAAWNRFRRRAEIYRDVAAEADKPGPVCRPPRPDGTIPPPRLADLDGEGYGRALSPLVKALGGGTDLDQVAAMAAGDLVKLKGIKEGVLKIVRVMLADHGLHLDGEQPAETTTETTTGVAALCRSTRESSGATASSACCAAASRSRSRAAAAGTRPLRVR